MVSLDHDGAAFDRLCRDDPALAPVHAVAPGFRPALFYSPYEAVVWSIVSARRPRAQGIALRARLAEQAGEGFDLAGERLYAVPGPSALLAIESVPGLPADRTRGCTRPRRPPATAGWRRTGCGRWSRRRRWPSCSSCPASDRSTAP